MEDLRAAWETKRRWLTASDVFPRPSLRDTQARQMLRRLAESRRVKLQKDRGGWFFAPVIHHPDEQTCRVCACTNLAACLDEHLQPCSWAQADLCSHCAAAPPRRAS